jgi:hypothetical protein
MQTTNDKQQTNNKQTTTATKTFIYTNYKLHKLETQHYITDITRTIYNVNLLYYKIIRHAATRVAQAFELATFQYKLYIDIFK